MRTIIGLLCLLCAAYYAAPARGQAQEGTFTVEEIPFGEGEPSLEMREAWVGLKLPYVSLGNCNWEIFTGNVRDTLLRGYVVDQKVAIDALKKKSPGAAQLWYDRGFPKERGNFCFATEPRVGWMAPPVRGAILIQNLSGGLATPLELYDFLATHAETIQAWNEAVKAFIAEERKPALLAVKL